LKKRNGCRICGCPWVDSFNHCFAELLADRFTATAFLTQQRNPQILDTIPYNVAINDYINNGRKANLDITNLPRKWNVAVVGTHDLYEHPHINDLAYMPATKDGVMGFNILVGGFFSQKRCAEAIPMDAWVPSGENFSENQNLGGIFFVLRLFGLFGRL
jgi:sulfite reductase beta subunit-like hemoprotein